MINRMDDLKTGLPLPLDAPRPWFRYSFRAETATEVVEFLQELLLGEYQFRVAQWTTTPYGEPHVELDSPESREMLLHQLESVQDSHVLRETFRQCGLAENPLTREQQECVESECGCTTCEGPFPKCCATCVDCEESEYCTHRSGQ